MTAEELRILATYRTHKRCCCPDCQGARRILWDRDNQHLCPRISLPEEDGAHPDSSEARQDHPQPAGPSL
jgi:hypothetical protein